MLKKFMCLSAPYYYYFHSERTSGDVAEKLPGKFGELAGKPGDFPEARGSLTPSQRLAKFVPKIFMQSAPEQRIAKGAGGKGPRQKSSKSVKKFSDTFRQFSRAGQKRRKNRQKVSQKVCRHFSRQFSSAAPFFRPLLGGSAPEQDMFGEPFSPEEESLGTAIERAWACTLNNFARLPWLYIIQI